MGDAESDEATVVSDLEEDDDELVFQDDDELDALQEMFLHATRAVTTVVVNAASQAFQAHSQAHLDKIPYHTSALSGMAWVNELLNGHPDCI